MRSVYFNINYFLTGLWFYLIFLRVSDTKSKYHGCPKTQVIFWGSNEPSDRLLFLFVFSSATEMLLVWVQVVGNNGGIGLYGREDGGRAVSFVLETASLCLSLCRSQTSDPFAHLLYPLPHVTSHCIYINTPFCMPTYLLDYKTIQWHKADLMLLFVCLNILFFIVVLF